MNARWTAFGGKDSDTGSEMAERATKFERSDWNHCHGGMATILQGRR